MKTNKHHILFEDFFDNDLEDELLPDDELDSDYVQDPETLKKNAEFIFQI